MNQPTPISLRPNEYIEVLCYYRFAISLDRCMGSCNTLNDLSNKVCAPKKTEHLNVIFFKSIRGINESSKILTRHISCQYKCNLNSRKCKSNQKWNNVKCW